MALKAGRVGVNKNQVDAHGNITASGGYTKSQADAKFATRNSLTANHNQFYFDYDAETQKYGFRAGAGGEFQPFNSGGSGGIGWSVPAELLTAEGLTFGSGAEYVSGGYYKDTENSKCYVDLYVKNNNSSAHNITINMFPKPITQASLSFDDSVSSIRPNKANIIATVNNTLTIYADSTGDLTIHIFGYYYI